MKLPRIFGDKLVGSKFWANRQFELLEQQMGFIGQQFGYRKKLLPNGDIIVSIIQRNGPVPLFITKLISPQTYTSTVTIETLHGWWVYVSVVGGLFSKLYTRNADNTYGPWQSSTNLGTQVGLGAANSILFKRGSQFSGRMREVVQFLGSYQYPIPYSYKWNRTHGIFVNKLTKAWWVIEIEQGVGIRAWPMVWGQEFTPQELSDLGITMPARPARDTTMGDVPELRVLAGASELNDFYQEAWPYTYEMGWAFNYDGDKAVNLSILAPYSSRYVNLWRIEITADVSGDPWIADLVGVEHHDIDWGLGFNPKYPHYIDGCGWTLLSFTGAEIEQAASPTNTAVAGSGSSHCPLDAFYRPNGSLLVARHYVDNSGTGTTTQAADWSSTDCYGYIELDENSITNPTSESSWTRTVGAKPQMAFDVAGRPSAAFQPYYRSTSGPTHTQTVSETGPRWASESYKVYKKSYTIDGTIHLGASSEELKYAEVFFKPLFDRELFGLHFHYKKTFIVEGGWQTYRRTNICGGDYLSGVQSYSGGGPLLEKFSTPLCGRDYGSWTTSTSLVLESAVYSVADPEGYEHAYYQVNVCGTGNNYYYTKRWDLTGNVTVGCNGPIASGASGSSTSTSTTATYLYDPKAGSWKAVGVSSTYSAADPMIVLKEDCDDGVLWFNSFMEAFTGKGCSYKTANDGDNIYVFGGADAHYPLSEEVLWDKAGWIGVPITGNPKWDSGAEWDKDFRWI